MAAETICQAKTKTCDPRYHLKPGQSMMDKSNVGVDMTIADTIKMSMETNMDGEGEGPRLDMTVNMTITH